MAIGQTAEMIVPVFVPPLQASPTQSDAPRFADDRPGEPATVVVVRSVGELRQHASALQRLTETALEPNYLYEPTMLIAALDLLADDCQVEVVLVYAPRRKNPAGPHVLCGAFPLNRPRLLGRWSLPIVSLWRHVHCVLCTPLVRDGCAEETLETFFTWLDKESGASRAVHFPMIAGDGPFHRLLTELLYRQQRPFWIHEQHCRALFRRSHDFDTYTQAAMPRKRRHELRRLRKRLAEQGELEFRTLESGDDIGQWIFEFLDLENRTWKGTQQTALNSTPEGKAYFESIARDAFARGKLMALSMSVDGQVIAQKWNFISGDGSFAFKIAYDEQYARFSPGVLLEMENIAELHRRDDVRWMDSCAVPDHPMINHLWMHRRTIQSLWIATRKPGSGLLIAAAPLARWLKQAISKLRHRRTHT